MMNENYRCVLLSVLCGLASCISIDGSPAMTTVGIHEKCTSTVDCPVYSSCRPSACDGFNCLCDSDYIATKDRRACVKANRIGQQCSGNTRCISAFASCQHGVCECFNGFAATNDGRCKRRDTSFVGEPCGHCEYPAKCTNGVCECAGENRPLTIEEFWVDPLNILQCRPRGYQLDICNGTVLEMPTPLQEETFVPRDNPPANDWSRVMSEKYINDQCTSHNQCPDDAKCRPNSCDGFICLCDENFISNSDRSICKRAIRVDGVCDSRTDICLSPFATCVDNICTCREGFLPTADGRCTTTDDYFLGGHCSKTIECAYPSDCVNGGCACVKPQRNLTAEEFWSDPTLTIQCRPNYYSLWKCNRTIMKVPLKLKDEIPMYIELELKVLAHEHHEHTDHGLHSHDDNVDVDATHVTNDDKKTVTRCMITWLNQQQRRPLQTKVYDHVVTTTTTTTTTSTDISRSPPIQKMILIPINIAGALAVAAFALLIGLMCRKRRQSRLKKTIPPPVPSPPMTISSSSSFVPEENFTELPGILKIPRPSVTVRNQYAKDAYINSDTLGSDYARCAARTCADAWNTDHHYGDHYGSDHILF